MYHLNAVFCLLIFNIIYNESIVIDELEVNITTENNEEITKVEALSSVSAPAPIDVPEKMVKVRKPVKLNMKQGLVMNQFISTYILTNAKDPLCRNHSNELKQGLRALESWAVQMVDASSKLPAGIFIGNLVEYGSYQQCLTIFENTQYGPIEGKFCSLKFIPGIRLLENMVAFRNVSKKRFDKIKDTVLDGVKMVWSVCVPDSCGVEDVYAHFNKSLTELSEGLDVTSTLDENHCSTLKTQPEVTRTQLLIILAVLIQVLVVSVASFIDWKEKEASDKGWFVDCFSGFENGRRVFSRGRGQTELDCLHGIRFISVCYVTFGHRYMAAMMNPSQNSLLFVDWMLKYYSTVILGGTVCVDTFFFVSALLVSYNFFLHVEKTKTFNLPLFYLYRYIRITIPMSTAIIVNAFFVQHMGSGPTWFDTLYFIQKPCQQYWWSTLLHIQNYVNGNDLCMIPAWFLTCDMLYFYISPLMLVPLWKWKTWGYINYFFIYCLSIASSFYVAWIYEYNGGLPLTARITKTKYFKRHYIAPHTRASPYILGIAFGYAVYKYRDQKFKMSTTVNILGWLLAAIVMSVVILGAHVFQDENHDYNRFESSVFLSCSRSGWTLGLMWLVWACIKGYGGIVNYVLCLHAFKVLGRIGYGIYLFHFSFQYLKYAASKVPEYYSDFNMTYEFCADITLMIVLAFIFTIFIEFPILQVQAMLFGTKGRKKIKPENGEVKIEVRPK